MKHSSMADIFTGKVSKLVALLLLTGIVCVVVLILTWARGDYLLRQVALIVLLVVLLLATLGTFVMRGRYADVLAQRQTLHEEVRLTQEQNHSLRSQVEVLAAMREVGRVISDDVDFCRILDQVFRILENLLRPEAICVIVKDQETGRFVSRAVRQRGETLFENIDPDEAEHPLFQKAVSEASLQKEVRSGRATLACPLIVDKEVAGAIKFVLNVEGSPAVARKKIGYTELVVNDSARHIALAIKTPSLHDRAIMDGLTALYSRTHFENQLKEHTNVARRYSKVLSLIMIDIDHFKRVNDVYGHLVGDVALSEVALAIKTNVRDCDTVYRYGGEEFTVILPETSAVQSQIIAERLRRTIERAIFAAGKNLIRVTISAGVAELDHGSRGYEDIISRADQALFAAKKAGRNSTFVWVEDPRPVNPIL